MRKVILREDRKIFPFNEPARDLRVLNKPLWLHQRDVLARYTAEEREADSLNDLESERGEMLVYRDNLFFDRFFADAFLRQARRLGAPCRVAFALDDGSISAHAVYVQRGIRREDNRYVADMWYFPDGVDCDAQPLVIDTASREMGYYHVPTHMSDDHGDLVYQVPTRAFCSIEHWVHTVVANVVFGVFANGARLDRDTQRLGKQLKMLWRSILERKQLHSSSEVVKIGRNCSIDPSAVIKGPTFIGDNVSIGAGVVIDVSIIGDNVDIMQGGQIQLSVISDRCYLPFRSSLFMSVMMEDSMVAQNTCLQFCSVGRNTFIGAGNTFTDFNLVPKPIRALNDDELVSTGMPVLGGCVGHHSFIGSGMVVYPARAIESDVILLATNDRRVVDRNVFYEESDHFAIRDGDVLHSRHYPRRD
jgi:carbonic anhydrase/acetyltransferase-like protein (isoleucine patch superfamily)